MSRRLYRQMAQARVSLNQALSPLSALERERVDREVAAHMDAARAADAKALERIDHPVIDVTPGGMWFRVQRVYRSRDGQHAEFIGEFRRQADALLMHRRERGRARVIDPRGKVIADNWHQVEVRA